MKRKGRTALCIACGVMCGLCVLAYTQSVRGEAEAARSEALARYGGDQVEVLVAARDIAPGAAISSSDVVTKMWVADLLPTGALNSNEEIVGKKASSAILAGEVLSSRRFDAESSLLDVPKAMTAVSVPAREVQAVGGAVEPGMLVDVYAAGSNSTELIGRKLKVLATSVSSNDGGSSIAWITLAVEPSRAQELVSFAMNSELYFTLPGEEASSSDASSKPKNASNASSTLNSSNSSNHSGASGTAGAAKSSNVSGATNAANSANSAGAASANGADADKGSEASAENAGSVGN